MATQVPASTGTAVEPRKNFDTSTTKMMFSSAFRTLVARTASGGNFATPRRPGASAGYQVPTGKKFIVFGVNVAAISSTLNAAISLMSATSDVGFAASIASGPDITTGVSGIPGLAAATPFEGKFSILMVIPAGKYLMVNADENQTYAFTIYGFEVDSTATEIPD